MIDSSENLNFIFLNSKILRRKILLFVFFLIVYVLNIFLTKSNAEFEKNVTCKKLISVWQSISKLKLEYVFNCHLAIAQFQ